MRAAKILEILEIVLLHFIILFSKQTSIHILNKLGELLHYKFPLPKMKDSKNLLTT